MEKHLQPKPSILAERYRFRHRKQNSNETVSAYVAELKKMSKSCEFGQWLEESLRDQLVCGINSDTIRQRLFAEDKLDFGKAYKLAVSMEAAEKDAAIVEGGNLKTPDCLSMTVGRRRGGAGSGYGRGGGAPAASAGQGGGGGSFAPVGARTFNSMARTAGNNSRARGPQSQCRVCGGAHNAGQCKFARYVCRAWAI